MSPLVVGVALLSLGGCVADNYPYGAAVPGYAPGYAPGYEYGYAQPYYAPPSPFFGDAFLFQFGGRRGFGHYDYGGGYDGRGRGDGGGRGRR